MTKEYREQPYPMIENIKAYVCKKHGISWEMLISSKRVDCVTLPKKEIVWLLKRVIRFIPYAEIARILKKDAKTIYSAYVNYDGYIQDGIIKAPNFECGMNYIDTE